MKRDMRKHKPVIMMWAAQYDEKKKNHFAGILGEMSLVI